jgi:hypothetical protein
VEAERCWEAESQYKVGGSRKERGGEPRTARLLGAVFIPSILSIIPATKYYYGKRELSWGVSEASFL